MPEQHTPQGQPVTLILQPSPSGSAPLSGDIDLLDMADRFLRQWRWWAGGMVVGGTMALGVALNAPPQYQASGIIRVAQMGSQVETVPEAITRMQTLSFRNQVIDRLIQNQLLTENDRPAWLARLEAKTAIKPVKDAGNYIEVSLTANNKDLGRGVVNTLAAVLAEREKPLVDERVAQIQKSIDQVKFSINEMEKRSALVKGSMDIPAASSPRNQLGYLELARMSEAGTHASLKQKLIDMENSKLAPTTRMTELVEPAGVSDRPGGPGKVVPVLAGAFAGGIAGTLLAFLLPAWRALQRRRAGADSAISGPQNPSASS